MELAAKVADGADGTPTMRVDQIVEDAIAEVAAQRGVNLISEEVGFVDNDSAVTLVVDPSTVPSTRRPGCRSAASAGRSPSTDRPPKR